MQVFISHSNSDRELAARLAKQLEEAGLNVWLPHERLFPGDNWPRLTGEALEASEVLVVLFTRRSVDSTSQRQDTQFALTSGKYHGRVVPVLVDFRTFEAAQDVPWILKKFDPIYITSDEESFADVVQRVQSLIRSASPDPV